MKAAVGLADLARLLAALPAGDHDDVAALLGFHRAAVLRKSAIDAPRGEIAAAPRGTPAVRAEAAGGMAFWHATAATETADREAPPPPPVQGLTRADLEGPGRPTFPTLPPPPLAPWRRQWSRLHAALGSRATGRDPDVPALVRIWARGEHAVRIPRVARPRWPTAIELWVDRSPRLTMFWSDQDRVCRQLEARCGRAALRVRLLDAAGFLDGDTRSPDPEVPVLVLSDLGMYAAARVRDRWLRQARRLRRARTPIAALVPCPPARWDRAVARAWCAIPWDGARGGAAEATSSVDALLTLIAPAEVAQPGLIRALRHLLPPAETDAATEVALWQHPDVASADATGLMLTPEASARWRARFAADVSPELQDRVRALLDAWHGPLPRELLHAETLAWMAWCTTPPPGNAPDALAFAQCLEASATEAGGDPADAPEAQRYSRQLLGGLPDAIYDRLPGLKNVWSVAFRDVPGARWPSTIRPDEVLVPGPPRTPTWWAVHQRGDALVFTQAASGAWPSLHPAGSPLAIVAARRPELRVRAGSQTSGTRHGLVSGLPIALVPGAPVTLETDRGSVTLGVWERPAWAVAAGRDRHGLWAAFAIGGVRQRLRWIPPGTFLMGSPETEEGSDPDEGPPHAVTITRGYWLGETPVTQALWQVVTGKNPSRMKTPDRPVEHVSWEACRAFVDAVNARLDGLAVRLPTEAEWERACRAGTTTATWAGDLTLVGANHAPELAAIAWYGGNSGVAPGLEGAADSSGWPEKQDPHTRAGSHPVGGKHANPYGLRDMLGNVYEWCDDPMRTYDARPVRDPRGEERQGSFRVFRGGSWDGFARDARAAYRLACPPGYAHVDLGFRLAGDQESAPGQAGRAPRSGAPEPRSGDPEPRSGDPGRGAAPAAGRDARPPRPGPRGGGSRG